MLSPPMHGYIGCSLFSNVVLFISYCVAMET